MRSGLHSVGQSKGPGHPALGQAGYRREVDPPHQSDAGLRRGDVILTAGGNHLLELVVECGTSRPQMVDPVTESGFPTGMPLVHSDELRPALGASPKFFQSSHQSRSIPGPIQRTQGTLPRRRLPIHTNMTRVEALVLLSRQGPLYRPSTLAPTNIDTAANVVWAALKPRRKSASEKVTNRSVGWCQCGLARLPVS